MAVWLLCISTSASAQFRFDTWTTDNGLPQNGVREITQTPDGYLWFTTFDGLVRFDGVRFTTFGTGNTKGIINNRFTGLYGDQDGTLYATTMEDGILTVYRDGVFTSYSSAAGARALHPAHPARRRMASCASRSKTKTAPAKSWYYLRDGKFVFSEQDVRPRGADDRRPGRARCGASPPPKPSSGATARPRVYPLDIGPITYNLNTFEDSTGHLWIGEYAVHRVGNGQVERFAEADGLPRSIHHSFWEEADGSVWFASGGGSTQGVGLVRYHGREAAGVRPRERPAEHVDLQRVPRSRGHDVGGDQPGPEPSAQEGPAAPTASRTASPFRGLSDLSRPAGPHLDRHHQGPEPLRERPVLAARP